MSTWLFLTIVAVVIGLGLLKLNLPLHNDQATFANYARMMSEGATLYSDVWDPKQPGIFYFFLTGGKLFGFNEAGFHVLELIYLTAGGVAGGLWLRPRLINRNSFVWYPILTVGWFYLLARFQDVGQVEVLAGPLILGHIALTVPSLAEDPQRRWSPQRLLLAGVLVGLLGWLKLLLMIIPAAVAVAGAIATTRDQPRRSSAAMRYLGWQLAGVAIPLAGMVTWFIASGSLNTLWYTFVTYPLSVLEDRKDTVLNNLMFRSMVIYLPMVPLALFAMLRRASYRRSRGLFLMATVAVVTSAVVVLTQTSWAYQAYLANFPAAILAVFGLDQIAAATRRARIGLAVVLVVALIPAAVVETPRWSTAVEHRFGFAGNAREFQSAMDFQYEEILDALNRVEIDRDDLVYGTDTRVVWLSGGVQAIPISPWLTIHGTPDLTTEALSQLATTPADWFYFESANRGTPAGERLYEFLEARYQFATETLYGEWRVPER